jgi:putative DNA primase/helicase
MPNLATEEGQAAVAPFLEGVDMVVVDNLATLGRHGRENETESWLPLQNWLLGLRRSGKSVLVVHHAGKGGNQRGTSAKEDILDTVIALRRPDDYESEAGARFEVHLEKARGVFGPEAKPFEAALRTDHGAATWTTRDIEDVELERVRRLKAEGMSIRDIAEETGMSKSRVQRLAKKLDRVAA